MNVEWLLSRYIVKVSQWGIWRDELKAEKRESKGGFMSFGLNNW